MADVPQQVATNSPGASKVKVALFFATFFIFTAAVIAVGFYRKSDFQAMGGRLRVTVKNESTERMRADLFVGPQLATVELRPNQEELIRFSPKGSATLEVDLLRYGKKLGSYEVALPSSDQETSVSIHLLKNDIMKYEMTGENGE
ncbi:MAG: hypothetical protein ABI579_01230 [Candidatus Sumerlaeota bacterium]